jgi:ADP-ribosylglycohydrolase
MLFELLPALQQGADWRVAARSLFNGGSFGNGGAMRVAPLGAWFADELDEVGGQARRSAEVTHAHPEGIAGAVAVAVAAAVAANHRREQRVSGPRTFVEAVREHVPESEVRAKLDLAFESLGPGVSADRAAELLGNGDRITAQDTVPFCIWMAGAHLDDYEEALWQTISVHGDMDTTCAIVGGIVAANVGIDGIPEAWREAREPLPGWHLAEPDS